MKFNQARLFAASVVAVLSIGAMQSANAVFTVPPEIADAGTNVGLVGAAVFTVMVGIKLYKWLRRAL